MKREYDNSELSIYNFIVCWDGVDEDDQRDPNRPKILVRALPESEFDRGAMRDMERFDHVDGCIWDGWNTLPLHEKVAQMMMMQLQCIDAGINPAEVHREFLKIPQYLEFTRASHARPFEALSTLKKQWREEAVTSSEY